MLELAVVWIFLERRNRDSIVKLGTKRVDCIVNYYDIAERHVLEDPQVFNVNIVGRLNALVSVKSMLD